MVGKYFNINHLSEKEDDGYTEAYAVEKYITYRENQEGIEEDPKLRKKTHLGYLKDLDKLQKKAYQEKVSIIKKRGRMATNQKQKVTESICLDMEAHRWEDIQKGLDTIRNLYLKDQVVFLISDLSSEGSEIKELISYFKGNNVLFHVDAIYILSRKSEVKD